MHPTTPPLAGPLTKRDHALRRAWIRRLTSDARFAPAAGLVACAACCAAPFVWPAVAGMAAAAGALSWVAGAVLGR